MDSKKNVITIEEYQQCCILYAQISTSRHSSAEEVAAATVEYQKAYVVMVDQGSNPQALKSILLKAINATVAQIDESDRLI